MTKIGIILGSTKPGRNGEAVAKWVYNIAKQREDAQFELVDVKDFDLPLYDEPYPAMMQQYTKEHTKKWSKKISEFEPAPRHEDSVHTMLDQVIAWADALKPLRQI